MALTLVIYDTVKMGEIEENIFFFTFKKRCKQYSFVVQSPDGTQEKTLYATIKERTGMYNQNCFPELSGEQTLKRNQELQKIINELEHKGYRANHAQLAIFMSMKTDKLILGSRKN
ncbi:hypothetical protein [Methylobacter sp.]|uniref:hypothetical protein n=1 Tax=Methylobacter sp. TaxID=2051955 RepID=UPI0024876FD4|nr:hypothetical protein [Methylobacter sp.]MDI1278230.1 hypothetical protein [Methylobacter sp.]MDI1358973.1 hypothetical protein [Methylobacter sp.]